MTIGGSGLVRAPQSRGSRPRRVGSLAPIEDPKPEVPQIPGAAPQKRCSVGQPSRGPLRPRLRLRLTWKRNTGCVAMATSSASSIRVSSQREELKLHPS